MIINTKIILNNKNNNRNSVFLNNLNQNMNNNKKYIQNNMNKNNNENEHKNNADNNNYLNYNNNKIKVNQNNKLLNYMNDKAPKNNKDMIKTSSAFPINLMKNKQNIGARNFQKGENDLDNNFITNKYNNFNNNQFKENIKLKMAKSSTSFYKK